MNSMEIRRNLDEDSNSRRRSGTMNCRLRRLLKEYQTVFREELLEGLPPRRALDHAIEAGDASPINKNAYLMSKTYSNGHVKWRRLFWHLYQTWSL